MLKHHPKYIFESMTQEELLRKFANTFELVNYAIDQARDLIRTGRGARVEVSIQNPAFIVWQEIAQGRDCLETAMGMQKEETEVV